jgi:hypothetical protein
MLKIHGRFAYRGIEERPRLRWPGGKGVAFYVALNVEHYSFGEELVEDLVPGMSKPDMLNASWRERGTRVGAWRLLRDAESLGIRLTVLLNSPMYDHAPGPLLSLAYSQEVNDSAAIIGRQMGAAEFAGTIIDQIDQLIEDASDGTALAFVVALHTNIIGQPFRRRHLARALRHAQGVTIPS